MEEINKFNQDPFPYRKTSVKKMQRNLLLDIFQHKTHTDEIEKNRSYRKTSNNIQCKSEHREFPLHKPHTPDAHAKQIDSFK